jgi:hypothetical protein
MVSRAAQTHLAGHMRPAGRVFETPAVDISNVLTTLSSPNNYLKTSMTLNTKLFLHYNGFTLMLRSDIIIFRSLTFLEQV